MLFAYMTFFCPLKRFGRSLDGYNKTLQSTSSMSLTDVPKLLQFYRYSASVMSYCLGLLLPKVLPKIKHDAISHTCIVFFEYNT